MASPASHLAPNYKQKKKKKYKKEKKKDVACFGTFFVVKITAFSTALCLQAQDDRVMTMMR